MIDSYRSEWNRTGQNMRIAIGVWSLGIMVFSITTVMHGHYGPRWVAVGLFYAILFKVVWPFTLAAAIRRRGGRFGTWFVMAVLFGFLITGVWYSFTLRKLPVLSDNVDPGAAEATGD